MIKGLDLNHAVANLEVADLQKYNFKFVIHKVSEGMTFVDDKYKARKAAFKNSGIVFGGYHWLSPMHDGKEQAEKYKKHAALEAGDLRACVDWEQEEGRSLEHHLTVLKEFLAQFDYKPIIYTGKWFLDNLMSAAKKRGDKITTLPDWLADYPLWLADYPHAIPVVPKPWKSCAIHQRNSHAATAGIKANGDYDECLVDISTLVIGGTSPKPIPTAPTSGPQLDAYGTKLLKLADSVGCHALASRMYTFMGASQPRYCAIFDVSKDANAKRLHVLDMVGMVVNSLTCGVGRNSDPDNNGVADSFSNEPGSLKTSLGVFKFAELDHSSKHGIICRLDGLEGTNSNMRKRSVIMHTATYVTDSHAGRSEGCLAIPMKHSALIPLLSKGSFGIIGKA